jgi:hypothetical protein
MRNFCFGIIVGALVVCYLMSEYGIKREQILLNNTRFIANKSYFVGCTEAVKALLPFTEPNIITHVCKNASEQFTTPLDELFKDD